jgi:hypothetical protein
MLKVVNVSTDIEYLRDITKLNIFFFDKKDAEPIEG